VCVCVCVCVCVFSLYVRCFCMVCAFVCVCVCVYVCYQVADHQRTKKWSWQVWLAAWIFMSLWCGGAVFACLVYGMMFDIKPTSIGALSFLCAVAVVVVVVMVVVVVGGRGLFFSLAKFEFPDHLWGPFMSERTDQLIYTGSCYVLAVNSFLQHA
jgi:hypothetical protein